VLKKDEIAQRKAKFSDQWAKLPATKRALFEKRLRGESKDTEVIPRRPEDPVLLSFAQRRLWFLDQLEPDSSLYNIPIAVRLTGQLNVEALKQSLDEIVLRHETLRTTFALLDGRPVQVIAPTATAPLPVLDLLELPEEEREAEAQRLAEEEARRPFDLTRGPLVRVTLLWLGKAHYTLLLNMHHIISDGWSISVFTHEMAALYQAFTSGTPPQLPELPIQYSDFAVWQRQWLQGEVLAAQLSYWKQQLGGDLPKLELPTDFPRPPIQTHHGTTRSFVLPASLTQAIETLSRREDATLFMTLLAVFKVLLHRYTGQTDIIVGAPVANRSRTEIEGLIGFFVNTLVMRTDLSNNPTFRELLGRVRKVTWEAYTHQDLPFEMLVEALQPRRDLSYTPLFQVMLNLHNTPDIALEIPGLTFNPVEFHNDGAKFDLSLSIVETGSELLGELEYSTTLFQAGTIARMSGHFQVLLEGIVANPAARVSDLPLLTAAERQQLLAAWNDTEMAYPHKCVHQLFEEQVERTPDAVAVVFEDRHLTCRALNRQANRLAHHLQASGVGPETLVGISVEHSLEMVVGLLGILKAGGAYVPLDPTYPQERLAFMLEDTGAPVLLTQAHLAERLDVSRITPHVSRITPHPSPRLVCLDTDWELIARQSSQNLPGWTTPNNLACAIYTSSSTEMPKGVMVEHCGLVNLTEMGTCTLNVNPHSRILQLASFSSGISLWDTFMALTSGATLCVAPFESLPSAPVLTDSLQEQAVTIMTLPPSILATLSPEAVPKAEMIVSTGEPCPAKIVTRWAVNRRFFNSYGLTEATIGSTLTECTGGYWKPPIGLPFINTLIYILDARLQSVPVGVPGELHVGGIGLARGYLGRPDLTAAKFIPNPFSEKPGARLHRTADLARHLPDGNIEFLGRVDRRVQMWGYRVELEQVEAILSQHPAVRGAAALIHERAPGDKQLVAYVVPEQGQSLTPGELDDLAKKQLPDYMAPSIFVRLETLPLTPNGKVNRCALTLPEASSADLAQETGFVAPRDALELRLAQIWEEVLDIRPIGVKHNFFELGGHSLLAVGLVAHIQQAMGQTLPLTTLFRNATIERLAVALRRRPDGA
jgi:amino acid adenylation domain-containing protein